MAIYRRWIEPCIGRVVFVLDLDSTDMSALRASERTLLDARNGQGDAGEGRAGTAALEIITGAIARVLNCQDASGVDTGEETFGNRRRTSETGGTRVSLAARDFY